MRPLTLSIADYRTCAPAVKIRARELVAGQEAKDVAEGKWPDAMGVSQSGRRARTEAT